VQVRSEVILAWSSERTALVLVELTWTEQPPAEIRALSASRMVSGAFSSRPITQILVPPTRLAVADTSMSVNSGVTIRLMIAALRWESVTLTAFARSGSSFLRSGFSATGSAFTATGSSPVPSLTCPFTTASATAWMRARSGSATLSSFAAASAALSAAFWRIVVWRVHAE
jgi:hypothetical protein